MNLPFVLKLREPYVFNPKVMPDPEANERLEARLREAAQRLAQRYERNCARRARHQVTMS